MTWNKRKWHIRWFTWVEFCSAVRLRYNNKIIIMNYRIVSCYINKIIILFILTNKILNKNRQIVESHLLYFKTAVELSLWNQLLNKEFHWFY